MATAIYIFILSWNEFLFAFMFTTGDSVRTLPVALQMFLGTEYKTFWGELCAAGVVTTLPAAILFVFVQRYLM